MRDKSFASPIGEKLDEINIKGLEVFARCGVHDEERCLGQRFYINMTIYTHTKRAAKDDALIYSTDYGAICKKAHDFMKENVCALLETAAERLARHLLLTFENIKGIRLEIEKPSAPVPLHFSTISVAIYRAWHTCVVAVGSNMGDKENIIKKAMDSISADPLCRIIKSSDLILTKPYGGVEQNDFLNGAFLLETLYDPEELLAFLKGLEKEAGRVKTVHWGPRTLDLDILLYDDEIISTKDLTVPHPDMINRDFVLRPLSQVLPGWVHPIYKKTALGLLMELEEKRGVIL